ncbi:DNA-3-methyladenine glycosylase II [Halovenus aranensis]|uniref:DNA-3-methyladenine glycosylase II n=1 Tax=Halovenus aranensis TaxID=890420 RepID=A0A1G8U6X4_9EURY|nr:DNA-3-methyladenine glycosylase [Halovenus aranensis]SDJ49374.1 DNA-3-methyladenine glycosylase II [Halovenus aranensis]
MTDDPTADEAIAALRADDTLEPYIREHGTVAISPADDLYQRLVVSLLRQQVSIDAADAVRDRLFEQFEVTPEAIAATKPDRLTDVGLSSAKAEYARAAAEAFRDREYTLESFEGLDDEAVIDELTTIRGVGPWTAKMFLLYGLGRTDVFPVEDLGIRRGMEIVCGPELTRGEMVERAQEWAPYRSYASLYLWRAYEG